MIIDKTIQIMAKSKLDTTNIDDTPTLLEPRALKNQSLDVYHYKKIALL